MDEQFRLSIDMPKELHYLFKVAVAQHKTTMRMAVLELIEDYINDQGVYVPIEKPQENVLDPEGLTPFLNEQDKKIAELELKIQNKTKQTQKGPDETIN